jgi:quercetin dioxygenase-like cupin family protein
VEAGVALFTTKDTKDTKKPMKHLLAGEGQTLNILGDTVVVKLSGEETGGRWSIMEDITPAGLGPPVHMHTREDECFYVLEGEFEFLVAGQKIYPQTGSFVYAPRNVPHTFRNIGQQGGRMLVQVQPAGLEKFFGEIDALPPGPPDMAKILPLFEKYGLQFLGLPLGAG